MSAYKINPEAVTLYNSHIVPEIKIIAMFQMKHPGIYNNGYSLDRMEALLKEAEKTVDMTEIREMLPALKAAAIEKELSRQEGDAKENAPGWVWDGALAAKAFEVEYHLGHANDREYQTLIADSVEAEIRYLLKCKGDCLRHPDRNPDVKYVLIDTMEIARNLGRDTASFEQQSADMDKDHMFMALSNMICVQLNLPGDTRYSVDTIKANLARAHKMGVDVSGLALHIPELESLECCRKIDQRIHVSKFCIKLIQPFFEMFRFWKDKYL